MEEASAWVIKLNASKVARDDLFAFEDWLNENEQHRQIFRQITKVWNDAGTLFDAQGEQLSEPLSVRKIVYAWVQLNPLKIRAVAAVAIFAMLISGWMLSAPLFSSASPDFDRLAAHTRVGERRIINLSDGSVIQLNTDTDVEVAYTADERQVRLLKGEANFQVAKNPERPFRVYAGNGAIEAVGTAFSVHLRGGTTEVVVTEGKVKLVRIPTESGADPSVAAIAEETLALVTAGRDAVISRDLISVSAIDQEDMTKRLSWRDGKLLFNGDTLETVVREFNRYTQIRIVISDQAIVGTRIVGYFNADDVNKFLHTLETSFNIGAKSVGDDMIYLYRKDAQS
ncbi:MAG: FecR domain-containing protein [Steroidobacteraceae bacterium]